MSRDPFDRIDDPIEARLRAMRPAELPPSLAESLGQARPRRVHWIGYLAPLAAAAVWAVAFLAWPRDDAKMPVTAAANDSLEPSDLRVFVPFEERSTLVGVQDLGLVETIPTRPVRIMRYTWIDDTTFRGDDGHSTLRRTEPRQQIVPVVLQVY
jgi:hypothetical protein